MVLRNGARACGAIVERVEEGAAAVSLDKYLRIYLQARTGDALEVDFDSFPAGREVELLVPADYCRDALIGLARDFLLGKPLTAGQPVPLFVLPLTGEDLVGEVSATDPEGIVVVTAETGIAFHAGKVEQAGVTYEAVGGLGREIERIREIVEYPFRHPTVFQRLGISPPRGIILYGPPGTGKTLITRALAHEVGASVHTIQGPEIISGWYGGSEQNLRQVFEQAKSQAPAIILIDEIDSIAPRRGATHGEVEHRVVATLLTLMDGLSELNDIVVIGTTNALNSIDNALRRPGRFEHEIHIGVPDAEGRREILNIHTRKMPLGDGVDLATIADRAYGFVGADIASLCRQAAYGALRRVFRGDLAGAGEVEDVSSLSVTEADFEEALSKVKPSATREVMLELPRDVSWESVGGLAEVKRLLVENVVYGMQRREAFSAVGIKPAKGVLLYGPPGTGKTLLAKVVAREAAANFIAVRGPELRSKWFGESEEKVRFIFAKAREVAPCIILFDELDAVAPVRGQDPNRLTDSIVNQLLSEMDGLETSASVFVIGTTNKRNMIDTAMLRPGRFDYQLLVPLPDQQAREGIFSVHLRGKPQADDISLEELARAAEKFSGADIAEVCRLAALAALRENDFVPAGVRLDAARLKQAIEEMKQTKRRLDTKMGLG